MRHGRGYWRSRPKLHRWATDGPDRRFGDLFNLVCDPAFLTVGWDRVRGNRGARTAGVDGVKPRAIGTTDGEKFLRELRDDLKARRFAPLPVRERMIPKASGKLRRLGIPTARDRVVQASLKLVLEPIFEADLRPCSYGFRPMRRAQDAIQEIHHFGRLSYEWVLEGDIASCFDEISHPALMDRVRGRIADRRVLALVKAFLIAGILAEDGAVRGSKTGTPQGGILSPCLANIALSALDEHFAEAWETMMAGVRVVVALLLAGVHGDECTALSLDADLLARLCRRQRPTATTTTRRAAVSPGALRG
jgi:RNA-directed DNA polymerase